MSKLTLDYVIGRIGFLLRDIGPAVEKVEKLISEYTEDDVRKNIALLINGQMKMSHEILEMLQVVCRDLDNHIQNQYRRLK